MDNNNYTVERRTWEHESPAGQPDYRGQLRWCVMDGAFVADHFATREEAEAEAYSMNRTDALFSQD